MIANKNLKSNAKIRADIIRAVLFAIAFAYLEAFAKPYLSFPFLTYRILYFVIFAIALYDKNDFLWIGNYFLSSTVEDIFYWIFLLKPPYAYQFYPIVYGIPIDDLIGVCIALILYYHYYRNTARKHCSLERE